MLYNIIEKLIQPLKSPNRDIRFSQVAILDVSLADGHMPYRHTQIRMQVWAVGSDRYCRKALHFFLRGFGPLDSNLTSSILEL